MRLRRLLSIEGPQSGRELVEKLGISQATLSRLVADARPPLLRVGRARSTRYAVPRKIGNVGDRLPLYRITESGAPTLFATLHAVEPRGFCFMADDGAFHFYDDLPWFLHDLRPSGFLGRQVPRRHVDLHLPQDILRWSADDALRYLSSYGHDAIGDFIIGDRPVAQHVANQSAQLEVIDSEERETQYPQLAELAQQSGAAGSSAAGEQPKFLALRAPGPVHVLVKFSPPRGEAIGTRWSDLLRAEHWALDTLIAHGRRAARSTVIEAGDRTFLEVERFDRVGAFGRRGMTSLAPLDAEFAGHETWSRSVEALVADRRVPAELAREVRWLAAFGRLIANGDMHHGNLSFTLDGTRVTGLAPVYDMLPMSYAPVRGEVVARDPELIIPTALELDVWPEALSAARVFWARVEADARISEAFRAIAAAHVAKLG